MPGFVEPPGLLEGCCGEVGSLEGAGESVPGLGLLGSRVPVGLSGLPGVAGLSVDPVEGFVEGSVEGLLVGSEDGFVEGSVLGLVLGSVEGSVEGLVEGSVEGSVVGRTASSIWEGITASFPTIKV